MGRREVSYLVNNFDKIGELSLERYTAVKALKSRTFYAKNIDFGNVVRLDEYGGTEPVNIKHVRPGDTIKMIAEYVPITGGPSQKAALTIRNINGIYTERNKLLIETKGVNIISFDCTAQLYELMSILQTPKFEKDGKIYENWATKENLIALFPDNATYEDLVRAIEQVLEQIKVQKKQQQMFEMEEDEREKKERMSIENLFGHGAINAPQPAIQEQDFGFVSFESQIVDTAPKQPEGPSSPDLIF